MVNMEETKRALLVGINYIGTSSALSGCINDVKNIKQKLLKQGYLKENIKIITDETNKKPTRKVILKSLKKLILSNSEELFFHYSGHGSYVKDKDGSEDDGKDECLVPLDYKKSGMIIDDEIKDLVMLLKPVQKMLCILDCCHSGTGMDLKYNLYEKISSKELAMVANKKESKTFGECIMLSGCADFQTSADAWEEGQSQGAMTFAFLKALNKGAKTYEELVLSIRKILKKNGYSQVPNLSSGRKLELKSVIRI